MQFRMEISIYTSFETQKMSRAYFRLPSGWPVYFQELYRGLHWTFSIIDIVTLYTKKISTHTFAARNGKHGYLNTFVRIYRKIQHSRLNCMGFSHSTATSSPLSRVFFPLPEWPQWERGWFDYTCCNCVTCNIQY